MNPSERPEQGSVLDPDAIVRRARRLRFRARPEALSSLSGAYLGARRGTGLAFAELRPYEPGDDVRHLDPSATARQGRPFVRRYQEERSQVLWLIVDASASMRFGPPGATKSERAAQAAALLAAAAIRDGDRAGLILVTDRVEAQLDPAAGPRQLARLIRTLVAPLPDPSPGTALASALPALGRRDRRGLVVVLSDFLQVGSPRPWRRLARRHDLVAARIIEPREECLPKADLLDLSDPESSTRRLVDSGSRRVRARYAYEAQRRREQFLSWCSEGRLRTLEIHTDTDPLRPLLRFFSSRAARHFWTAR